MIYRVSIIQTIFWTPKTLAPRTLEEVNREYVSPSFGALISTSSSLAPPTHLARQPTSITILLAAPTNSLPFSHETASQVAYVLTRIKNLENSDSISLIGFSNTQLEKAVKSHPGVLLYASLDNTIKFKPKIKIFQDLGFSANDIAEIIYKDLWSLYRSADRVIPSL
ncbi:uncharacterized protein Fot_42862 [Forsythia ovata]|uniref:Uncharacterized protein n=1 Tax=Forsythia ovata TaxID=205694 RepID=A0ABD1RME3_9LAMI